jgi:hypothetical protein
MTTVGDAGVDGQNLEAEVRDEPDALGPVGPQGLLAADHPVTAEQPHGHRWGNDGIVGEVLEQRVDVVGIPVPDPLLRERLRLGVIHRAMIPRGHLAILRRQRAGSRRCSWPIAT